MQIEWTSEWLFKKKIDLWIALVRIPRPNDMFVLYLNFSSFLCKLHFIFDFFFCFSKEKYMFYLLLFHFSVSLPVVVDELCTFAAQMFILLFFEVHFHKVRLFSVYFSSFFFCWITLFSSWFFFLFITFFQFWFYHPWWFDYLYW